MHKIIISPSKYVQGSNTIASIGEYTRNLGNRVLVIADDFVLGLVKNKVEESYKGFELIIEEFNKECCKEEIERLRKVVTENNIEVIVGIGGGKTIDTAKAVGYYEYLKVVAVPTVASTDAPTSSLSVIYTKEGVFEEYLMIRNNPELVLMDLDIIATAPSRLLSAGIGDALSTYFEARACSQSNAITMAGGQSTLAALNLARLCYDTLMSDSISALAACDNNVVTKALENIVEANTYLSGLGFESSGLAAAHAIHNGMTEMHQLHHLLHGEKVAFGVLVQLVLENDVEELNKLFAFNRSVGLPICLSDMNCIEYTSEDIMKVAITSCAEDETIHNMPFEVTPQDVYAAIMTVDTLGTKFKG